MKASRHLPSVIGSVAARLLSATLGTDHYSVCVSKPMIRPADIRRRMAEKIHQHQLAGYSDDYEFY